MMNEIFKTKIFHFTVEELGIFLGATILIFLFITILKKALIKIFSKKSMTTVRHVQKINILLLDNTKSLTLLLLSFVLSAQAFEIQVTKTVWIKRFVIIIILFQLGVWGSQLIRYFLDRYAQKKLVEDSSMATSLKFSSLILRIILFSFLVLVGLDNMGFDVTTMIAGLGIGGIAIALAAQNVLGDLFASLSIVLDKPFVLGDFIIVGDDLGTIEKIGLKTTRMRSLSGEQLVFPNSDLLSSRIRNYQTMQERRVVFQFGVIYQTSTKKLGEIPSLIQQIIDKIDRVRFDRAHFTSFGDSSYDFEVVYWLLTPEYLAYMDAQQKINLELVKCFREKSIDFAYPTRTLFIHPDGLEQNEKAS